MNNRSRLIEIDALRGLAALGVLLFHFSTHFPNAFLPAKYFEYGVTGVDLFFMISGFVIFMSISSAKSLKDFWFARFNRLFPAYWLSIVVALVAYYLFTDFDFHKPWNFIAGNILMMQPPFKTPALVYAYWTLYTELCFYFFISIIWRFRLMDRIETIVWIGLIVIIAINGGYIFLKYRSPVYMRLFIIGRSVMPLISYFSFFAGGILFYKVYIKGLSVNRAILLLGCFLVTVVVHNLNGNFLFGTMALMICTGFFYTLFALIVTNRAAFLKYAWLGWLGAISYALYLIHESIGIRLSEYLSNFINTDLAVIGGIAVSVTLAVLVTWQFEKPVHKWLTRLYYSK